MVDEYFPQKHCWHKTRIVFLTHPKSYEAICCNCGKKDIISYRLMSNEEHGKFAPKEEVTIYPAEENCLG